MNKFKCAARQSLETDHGKNNIRSSDVSNTYTLIAHLILINCIAQ
jgi:hypothetical protein